MDIDLDDDDLPDKKADKKKQQQLTSLKAQLNIALSTPIAREHKGMSKMIPVKASSK